MSEKHENAATPAEDDTQVVPEAAEGRSANEPGEETSGPASATAAPEAATVARGPRAFTVLLGLVVLAVAGMAMVSELTDVDIDWTVSGPFALIAVGVAIAAVGLAGMVSRRSGG